MTYGEPQIRKCVPLALGLISSSQPQLPIIDALSKYSHDQDLDVALNAILAMGLVGAGTNNARLAQMLRMLAVYYATEPDCLFVIRIAQVCPLLPRSLSATTSSRSWAEVMSLVPRTRTSPQFSIHPHPLSIIVKSHLPIPSLYSTLPPPPACPTSTQSLINRVSFTWVKVQSG